MHFQRIAVSGSAGIGKSTLCYKLANVLGYPLLPDVTDAILCKYGYSGWREVTSQEEIVKIRFEALERKIEQENSNEFFVSDKSVVDYLGYWDLNTSRNATKSESEQYEMYVSDQIKRYDLVLLLMWGRLPLEDIPRRNVDEVHQFHVHSAITFRLLQFKAPFVVFNQKAMKSSNDILTCLSKIRHGNKVEKHIGLFIGTFDPPTNAHLDCALKALELLDEIWFCPNPDNPNSTRTHLPLTERARMLSLIVSDHPGLKVYLREKNPYVDSSKKSRPRCELIEEIQNKHPTIKLWIIIGTDKLKTPVYQSPDQLICETGHIIFPRPHEPSPDMITKFDLWIVMPPAGSESSSEVKVLLKKGLNANHLLPQRVVQYIYTHKLYSE
jgi:nicotinate (nicotinamide) nucleotide adenylyltransferase